MKKVRKGFTLIELLIVVAIIGVLSAMMAMSSSDAIDVSSASAILNNLQSMKDAAFDMYMEEPAVASLSEITNDKEITLKEGTDAVTDNDGNETTPAVPAETKTVGEYLGERLGRLDLAENYGIVGDVDRWYVYYTLTDNETAKVKSVLAKKANGAGLLGAATADLETLKAVTAYYVATDAVIALRVR